MALVKKQNKRHGPDPIVMGKKVMIALAWVLLLLIIIMFGFAEGHMNIPIYGSTSSSSWDSTMLRNAYLLMFPLAITSAIGLIFNSWRNHRKYDSYSKTLIFTIIFASLFIVFFSIHLFIS